MQSRIFREVVGFVLAALCLAGAAGAAPLTLTRAYATITVGGATEAKEVELPYHWDRRHRGQAGTGVFELSFSLPSQPDEPYALYLLRLGNAYEIWLNGSMLERQGDLGDANGADHGQVPRLVAIPARLLQKQNGLVIRIRADSSRRAGVPVLVVGPDAEVGPRYRQDYRWRATGSLAVAILSLLVGTTALALWLTQTEPAPSGKVRRDDLYLFASIAEFSWALRVGAVLVEDPPLPWPIWGALIVTSLGAWVCCMLAFCCLVAGWRNDPRVTLFLRLLWVLLAAGAAAAFASLQWQIPWLVTVWYGLLGLVVVPFSIVYGWATFRQPPGPQLVVAGAVILNAAVGLRDWAVLRFADTYGSDTFTRYSSVLFGLTLGYIVISRFRIVSSQARDLLVNLSARVSQKEAELEQSYRRMEQLALVQERAAERSRILRDLHDGVGSHISSAIRQLQSGRASTDDVLQTLRDSLDHLKLSIDAMNVPPGDITVLLANLRYRLEPRFAASDVELQWNVDLLNPLERLDGNAMRQLQFMLFEALSNVLQHANASVLRIEASALGRGARLRIVDNGRGFDATAPLRKGLASMQARAASIGATLALASEPGRTVVEIVLP